MKHFLRLLAVAVALLLLSLPLNAIEYRVAPTVTWLQGNSYFTITGGWASDDDPVKFRSKLDFPTNCWLAGVQASVLPARRLWGLPWRIELSAAKSMAHHRSWGADSDWVFTPVTAGSAAYDTSFFAGTESHEYPTVYQARAAISFSRPFGPGFSVEAGPEYRLLYASHVWKGFHEHWQPFNDYWAAYDDTIVMKQRFTFHLAGIAAGAAYNGPGLSGHAQLVVMPWVRLFYLNDHVLRYMSGHGDNVGRGYSVSAGGTWRLPGRMGGIMIGATYEMLRVYTWGHDDVYHFDDPGTIPDESLLPHGRLKDSVPLRQQSVAVFLDVGL
jgi:hypothetical protein